MGVAVQRLRPAGRLSQSELPQKLDFGGRLEAVGDPGEVVGVEERQLILVVDERLVDLTEPLAGRHRLHLAFRLHVLPEGDDVAKVARSLIDFAPATAGTVERSAPFMTLGASTMLLASMMSTVMLVPIAVVSAE